jgi:ribosomal protein S25
VKKAKDKKEKKKTFEKKPKKKKSQKEKFLEFQKRKIEKEIRSFHSLEPSSISNMLNIKKEMSIPSYTHNKPVELTNNIYPE